MVFRIQVHTDGENEPSGREEVVNRWQTTWREFYSTHARLEFGEGINLKRTASHNNLSRALREIVYIRNPDIFFSESTLGIDLGGIEITTHSPDGSNVEKRYPYIWASRQHSICAFIASPYSKQRPGGQINRLPYRHTKRNMDFLEEWAPLSNAASPLFQIVPIKSLQGEADSTIPAEIKEGMLDWCDLGDFFAHLLASRILAEQNVRKQAQWYLEKLRQRLIKLSTACMANAELTEPSSLYATEHKWIQIYNSRPESGHWERGEGQFDSIDGRLMFTLDTAALLPLKNKPSVFEFWLPQMTSSHPWVREQVERNYGSKRFRNIMVVLTNYWSIRFANDLSDADWRLLQVNPSLVLERQDWKPGLYKVTDVVAREQREKVARDGTKHLSQTTVSSIVQLLNDKSLFFSSHRAYIPGWKDDLYGRLQELNTHTWVLLPRIPERLLDDLPNYISCTVVSAERCTREHLLMLRQIHKANANRIARYR